MIGFERLEAVWDDMSAAKQDRPSWLSSVPDKVGTAKAGKLTADQWRTTSFVHLTVTLIRLWGNEAKGSRLQNMLQNFMDCLTAIKLGTMRTTNAQIAEEYKENMTKYLKGLLRLYPSHSLTPNHHLAMHFGDHLNRFGPTHASRAFVFERQNLLLQRIHTNGKIGNILLDI